MDEISHDKYVEDEEFLSISGGDPAIARLLHMQLTELAQGKGGNILAEMAQEILTGRVDLREAIRTRGYEEEVVSGIEKFRNYWDSMSSEEKQAAERAGNELLSELRSKEDKVNPGR